VPFSVSSLQPFPFDPEDDCWRLVGMHVDDADRLLTAQKKMLRTIGGLISADYRPNRLNVQTDDQDRIVAIDGWY
jgi:hypothetical protein